MQFHLNGFKPGNPEISEAADPDRRVAALGLASAVKSTSSSSAAGRRV